MSPGSLIRRTADPFVAQFTRTDGSINQCELIELSREGAAIRADVKLPIGEFVLIGQLVGRVSRHYCDLIWVEFAGREYDSSLAGSLHDILSQPSPQNN